MAAFSARLANVDSSAAAEICELIVSKLNNNPNLKKTSSKCIMMIVRTGLDVVVVVVVVVFVRIFSTTAAWFTVDC